jgi:hypothetical protein
MQNIVPTESPPAPPVSPLLLSDRLLTLAEQADQAGYCTAAKRLVSLALTVLDEKPLQ